MGRNEEGSGTLWVLAVALVVFMVGITAALRGAAVIARHRAAAAADFAALAAAVNALEGSGSACAAARSTAAANGGHVAACDLAGSVATVTVTYRLGGPLSRWQASGMARARPVPETEAGPAP